MTAEILVSTYRGADPECLKQIHVAIGEAARAGIRVSFDYYGSAFLAAARNAAVMQMDADYVVLIDDDMVPEPQAIVKLLSNEAEVCSALCTTRVPPVQLAAKYWDEPSACFMQLDDLPDRTRPVTGAFGVGAAFLAIRRDVIERVTEHYLSANDWMEYTRRQHERMKVKPYYREEERQRISAIRRKLFAVDRHTWLFDHIRQDNETTSGEDIGFFTKLLQLKVPVTIDPRITVGHYGAKAYTLKDYRPHHIDKPIDGVTLKTNWQIEDELKSLIAV